MRTFRLEKNPVGIAAILLLIVLQNSPAFSQSKNQSQWPTLRQQAFSSKYMKEYPLATPFANAQEIDEYFNALTSSWMHDVHGGSDSGLPLSPYIYPSCTGNLEGNDAPDWVWQHVTTQFVVPSFVAYFNRFEEVRTQDNAYLLRPSDMATLCDRTTLASQFQINLWKSFYQKLNNMPRIISDYVSGWKGPDMLERRELKLMNSIVTRFLPLADIKDAINNSQYDSAFIRLTRVFNMSYPASQLFPIAQMVWQLNLRLKRTQAASDVLDLLAKNLTTVDLSDDSLYSMYRETDSSKVGSNHEYPTKAIRPAILVPDSNEVALGGSYLDLKTNRKVSLAAFKGKLILFDFWASWCVPCIEDIPRLKRLSAAAGDKLMLISVCSDPVTNVSDTSVAKKVIRDYDIKYLALWDDSLHSLTDGFNVNKLGWPRKFLVNESGHFLVHPRERDRKFVTIEEVEAYLSKIH
ncbi:MAG: TlpA disulfide reductase family protein [Bacteroidota bacterium]|jgi:thiol-disulfide isomerase/thioredoxin